MNLVTITEGSPAWAKQNQTGRAMAGELLDRMIEKDCPPLLGWALKDMVAKGEFGGIEVGFAQEIAERLIRKG